MIECMARSSPHLTMYSFHLLKTFFTYNLCNVLKYNKLPISQWECCIWKICTKNSAASICNSTNFKETLTLVAGEGAWSLPALALSKAALIKRSCMRHCQWRLLADAFHDAEGEGIIKHRPEAINCWLIEKNGLRAFHFGAMKVVPVGVPLY